MVHLPTMCHGSRSLTLDQIPRHDRAPHTRRGGQGPPRSPGCLRRPLPLGKPGRLRICALPQGPMGRRALVALPLNGMIGKVHEDTATGRLAAAPATGSWDANSPIMILGALVLDEGIVGMTEASAIRRPSTPRTRSSASTTASSPGPIAQVPTGWR